jgi:hypothetical protein
MVSVRVCKSIYEPGYPSEFVGRAHHVSGKNIKRHCIAWHAPIQIFTAADPV